jgi:hypothetical protein
MKKNFLTFAACAALFGSPLPRILAADSTSASAPVSPAKPQPPSVDPAKVEWNTARRKAMDDPDVKAAMDAARTAQIDASKKILEKIREIDPALGPAVDKEEERMKPRAPMAPRPKPSPKAKKTAAKTPADATTDDKASASPPAAQ